MLTGYIVIASKVVNKLDIMVKPVGGRGKKAPYETTHVRVPVPIKPQVDELIECYRQTVVENENVNLDQVNRETSSSSTNDFVSLPEAIILAKQILKQKKSARVSLEKLLTSLYGSKVSL